MKLINRLAVGRKSWSQPPSWAYDDYRLAFLNAPASGDKEEIDSGFVSMVQTAYKRNGILFALNLARMTVFSQATFMFQRELDIGRPGELFSTPELSLLRKPWLNATTGDLLARMIQDADLSGNAFVAKRDRAGNKRLRRLRPDWVTILLGSEDGPADNPWELDADVLGYMYEPGGRLSTETAHLLLPNEVAHFAPVPDPEAAHRGMSWISPVIRELEADNAATAHKLQFFKNGATPQVVVSLDREVKEEQFKKLVAVMEAKHKGLRNAYKTWYMGGGADVTVVGKDLKQLDFRAVQGAGEPLALDTPIPTPTGWTTMGEITVGDQVLGRDGRPANVVGVSPVHENRDCYRVVLRDRTEIVADASHLWVATDRGTASRAERTYTTSELFELFAAPYSNGVGGHRLFLPQSPILDLPEADLLIDPYVLGAWLGDGQTAGAAICGAADDLKYIAAEIEARGYVTNSWKVGPDKVAVVGIPGGLRHALVAEGVLGNKRIPARYLRASFAQRLDLLRGLMDTDGTVDYRGRGGCEFTSKWEHLARQVIELVRSLGYRATLSSRADARSRTGLQWRVTFRVEQDRIPFLLPRKVDACIQAGDPTVHNRSIVLIERVESVPVRCIAVDTADHLFLAGEGFTPTHNTRMAAAAGVPPVIAGFSEGLQAATYSNYGQARRRFADGTLHPLWMNVAGSLASIVDEPDQSRLWYDDRNIPFLREDRKDVAEIQSLQSQTIRNLNDSGFTPESVKAAVIAEDWSLLVHTGLFSVQLQPPGSTQSVEVTSPQKANELISAGWKPVFLTPGRESK